MGTDIHLFVEKKENNKWIYVGKHDIARNYPLFAILANVRNGIRSGKFEPISYPRGLPNNVSPEVRKRADNWILEFHSHSWFLLKELNHFDWDGKKVKFKAYVNKIGYDKWKKTGKPWGAAQLAGGKIISHEEMEKYDPIKNGYIAHTMVEWVQTYRECCIYFVEDFLKELNNMSRENGEDIRIIFWFDN